MRRRASSRFRRAIGRSIRSGFERLTGWDVYTVEPRGVTLPNDVRRYLPKLNMRVVFDVGANVGQSARGYLRTFPAATIYSFEPVADTFVSLKASVILSRQVRCFQLAFGDAYGEAEMVLEGDNDRYCLQEHHKSPTAPRRLEQVQLETVDRFCRRHSIEHINLLKIDAEGHDLAVLRGADEMLRQGNIDLVQAEVAMTSLNSLHAPFASVTAFLEKHNYHLFGIYDQVGERAARRAVLRRSNAVFVAPRHVSLDE